MSCTNFGVEETFTFANELNSSLEMFNCLSSTANRDLLESTSASFEDVTNKRNELCPYNQDNISITNIQHLGHNDHKNIKTQQESNKNSTLIMNQTYIVPTCSSVELVKKGQSQQQQQGLQSISSYLIEIEDLSKAIVDNNFCNTCCESYYVCSCCSPANSSTSTKTNSSEAFTSLKPAMTNSTYQSLFDKSDFLSSTPMFSSLNKNRNIFHSTLRNKSNNKISTAQDQPKSNKKENSKRFELLKNCVFPSRKPFSKVKKQDSNKNYKFKLINTNTGFKLKNQVIKSSNPRKRFPRTSSFNSNGEERDCCDLTDFYEISKPSQVHCESFLPVASGQKAFNNYGDFLVWYV